MSCCGKHLSVEAGGMPDVARRTLPTDECVFCAEKHFSTAKRLAVERGYEGPNRQDVIGEICLAQWHCWHVSPACAESMRKARHLVQLRREGEVEWAEISRMVDALASAEAERIRSAK